MMATWLGRGCEWQSKSELPPIIFLIIITTSHLRLQEHGGGQQARAGARLQEPLLVPASAGHECCLPCPPRPAPPLRRAAPPRHLATRRVSAKLYDNMYSNVFLILSSAILLPAFGSNQAIKGKFKQSLSNF